MITQEEALRQEGLSYSSQLTARLETFLEPQIERLDAYLDKRLVRTFVATIAALISFRNPKQGLCLSELGAYVTDGAHAPAGTKRISNLLHSTKWGIFLIEWFLWMRAEEKVQELAQQGERVLCVWDGSVIEKPESEKMEGLCAVKSSKARRLRRSRKGVFNQSGGKPISVMGMEWIAILVLGMHGHPMVARMKWWTRKTMKRREVERQLLAEVVRRWGKKLFHIFDRGYAGGPWLEALQYFGALFVMRWKKGHVFEDQHGQKRKLWEIARGKRAWMQELVWDEKKKCYCKIGVLALPVRHASYAGPLWLVVGRRGGEPWYLLTNVPIETKEAAWEIIIAYAKRWKIEMSFRYGKSELAMESLRLWAWDTREKLLFLVTLVYAYLLSLLDATCETVRTWVLRQYCHRTGKRYREARIPLYRLRWAISRLWLDFRPIFQSVLFLSHPKSCSNFSG